jgi:hypothetical protein
MTSVAGIGDGEAEARGGGVEVRCGRAVASGAAEGVGEITSPVMVWQASEAMRSARSGVNR